MLTLREGINDMDVGTTYRRAVESFVDRVAKVNDDQWRDPTPCEDWNVRALVNHLTYENRWTVPLMEGASLEEVGNRFDGDLLGTDPILAAQEAARSASACVAEQLPKGGTVQLSFGEAPKEEYVMQLGTDHLIHGWDLAVAIGADTTMDPELVATVSNWFDDREEMYRGGGVIAERRELTGEPQHDLLARFGRDADWSPGR